MVIIITHQSVIKVDFKGCSVLRDCISVSEGYTVAPSNDRRMFARNPLEHTQTSFSRSLTCLFLSMLLPCDMVPRQSGTHKGVRTKRAAGFFFSWVIMSRRELHAQRTLCFYGRGPDVGNVIRFITKNPRRGVRRNSI